jgi:hypothetical protein
LSNLLVGFDRVSSIGMAIRLQAMTVQMAMRSFLFIVSIAIILIFLSYLS